LLGLTEATSNVIFPPATVCHSIASGEVLLARQPPDTQPKEGAEFRRDEANHDSRTSNSGATVDLPEIMTKTLHPIL
jgi:hypothetical protein